MVEGRQKAEMQNELGVRNEGLAAVGGPQATTQRLRSRWRLCRLTDVAYPLRVKRLWFGEEGQGSGVKNPRPVSRAGASDLEQRLG